jgi:hypothetical protein
VYDPILLLKNNGDGTYAPPVPIAFGGETEIESIASVDWNHNGYPDLVVGTANPPFDEYGDAASYSYSVLLNDGHGNFTNAPETPIPVSTNTSLAPLAVYDLRGNGQYDIIHPGPTTSNGDRTVEVIGKDPYLGYTPQMELPLGISSDNDPTAGGNLVYPAQFAFADLNGDGIPDIVTRLTGYYRDYPNFSVIMSTPTGYATGQQIQDTNGSYNDKGDFVTPYNPGAVGVGNFSGTGYNDVAAVYAGEIQVYQNDGKGNLTDPAPIPLASGFIAMAATFADLNNDGIPDVVVIEQPYNANGENGEPLYVWTLMANGHGGFVPTFPAPIRLATSDESIPTSMTLADVNGGGYPDVILGSSQSGEVRLAINDGTGTMRPPTQHLPYIGSANGYTDFNETRIPGTSQPQQVFADFANSGQLGFVTIGPGGLDVYLRKSDGTFKHTATLPSPFSDWVKVGDLNNDGIPDILDGDGNDIAVYLGNGDGTFRQAPTFIDQASGYSIRNITLADVNNDGNLDAVATLNGAFGVLFGDGKGDLTFNLNTVVPAAFPSGGFVLPSAVLGDFDGDGKLDLLVPTRNSSNGTITLTDYLGNGNGTFTAGPIIYSGASQIDTQDLVGDLNGDSKLDLVSLNGTAASVYLGDGHGGFQLASTIQGLTMGSYALGPAPPSDVALGDFSGDGKLDLAVAYYELYTNPNVVQIYPGDGTGNFGTPQAVTVGVNPFTLVSIPRAPFLDVGSFAVTDHRPVANTVQATDAYESSVSIPVLASDTDVDNVPLTITAVSTPAHGTMYVDPSTETIIYTSARGFTGTDTFTYTIADPDGVTSTATVAVTVMGFTIGPLTFPGAQIGLGYSSQLSVSGGTGPYTFAITSGALPVGLSLSSSGLLSGTATNTGTSNFVLTVMDALGRQMSEGLSVTAETPINVLTVSLPTAQAGTSFTSQLSGSGGTAPYTFAVTGGALPTGITLSPGGQFSGVPDVVGNSHFVLTVTDGIGATTTLSQSITVDPLTVTATQLAAAVPGPLKIALDFGEALQPASAQTVGNFKIAAPGSAPLPIQSAVYADDGTQHQVVLTVALGTSVAPNVYSVSINAANLVSASGTPVERTTDQLWVDVTSGNTLKQITAEPDGSYSVYGPGDFLGYGAPAYVLAGNFAGNGRTDLVVVTNTRREETDAKGNDVSVYDPILLLKSNGDGSYGPPVPIGLGGQTEIQSITSVDWNHDGFPDLVVGTANPPFDQYGDPSSYSYYVLLNDGHGNFSNAPNTPIPSPNGIGATAVYDLGGDGQYEIVHPGPPAADNSPTLEVIGKDPHLGYTPQMELEGNPGSAPAIFADLNGDGRPDIITSNLTIFMSTPTGYGVGQSLPGGFNALAVAAGNFTGNGHTDVAAVSSGGVRIFQNDGKGNFTWFDTPSLQYDYVRAATFTDLNHDGIPDLVVIIQPLTPDGAANGEPLSVWTLMADGHGGFTPTTPAPVPLASTDETIPTSMVLADIDGDGNPDVVLGSSQLGEVRLAINDGTGTMRPPTQPLPYLGTENGYTNFNATHVLGVSQKVFADFDNSGFMGFVALGPGGLDVYVRESDGTFKHTASLADPLTAGPLIWVKVGDLNNDGVPDILCGNGGGSMAVYLGNGDGTFRPAPTFLVQAGTNTAFGGPAAILNVTLVDVNHDGNLDAVVTMNIGNPSYAFGILFGDGKGDLSYNANTEIRIGLRSSAYAEPSATLADFYGDGKLDLLVPTYSQGGFGLSEYLGVGNGTFTPGPIISSGASQSDTEDLVGDLTGNGNLDLVAVNGTTASVYLGDGQGGFSLASTIDLSAMGTQPGQNPILPANVALGDFSGDGKLDMAVSYYDFYANPDVVRIYPGDGKGNFGTPQAVTVGVNPFTLVSIPRTPFLAVGSVTVTGQGPVASNDSATVVSGSSVSIPVLKNDTDADNAPLTIKQVSNPGHGVAHLDPSTDTIVYAPASGFTGTDTFSYTIADPAGVTSTATVTVTVVAIAITPATLPDPEVGVSYTAQLSASGGTGPYSFAVTSGSLPNGLQLSASGLFSGMASNVGSSDVTITVTDSTGLSEPQDFVLTVIPSVTPPSVTQDPANATAYASQTVTFTAAASGLPAPTVQWQVTTDGGQTFSNIAGATSANYSFTAQPGQDGDEYQAIFTNQAGSATTTPATLTVYYSPIIAGQPVSEAVPPGTVVAFNAAAVSDPPVTGVQWQLSGDGGQTFSNISGATGTEYSVTAGPGDNNDQYRAVFTNRIGSATTNAATLTVLAGPVVTTQPTSQVVLAGTVVTLSAAASGDAPLGVQWQVSSDGGKTFTDILDATAPQYSFTAEPGQDNNQYQAVFANAAGTATTIPATLTVQYSPIVTSPPASQSVYAGTVVTFSAAAAGDPAVTAVGWQVSTDGGKTFSAIDGATSNVLTITPSVADDQNEYEAVFTNAVGSTTSQAATLSVMPAVPLIITPLIGQSKLYGAPMPALTYDVRGFINGDNTSILSGSLGTTATAASAVGAYAFTLGTLNAPGKYTLQLAANPPTFAVTRATLTITPVANQSMMYGSTVTVLTYTASGFVNGDSASLLTGALATTATAASAVGSYAFTLGTLSAGGSYTLQPALNSPTFAVTPGPVGKIGTDVPGFGWTPVPGADHYSLKVTDTTSGRVVLTVTKVIGSTYALTSPHALTPGHKYVWSVTPVAANGKALASSRSFSFQIAPLGAPRSLTLSGPGNTDMPTFTWTPVIDALHPAAASYTLIVTPKSGRRLIVSGLTGRSYTLTTAEALTPGQSYTWTVAAVSTNGQASMASASASFRIAALTPPVLISENNGTFTWQPVTDANHYSLKIEDSTTHETVVSVTGVSGTSYTLTAAQAKLLKPGRSYTWLVTAVSANGKASATSRGQKFTAGA